MQVSQPGAADPDVLRDSSCAGRFQDWPFVSVWTLQLWNFLMVKGQSGCIAVSEMLDLALLGRSAA